jgi:arylsulfatase A-like enzyme
LSNRSAIVVIVDRLGAGFLGPYGNTWVETPELNRMASQCWLFENAITDSIALETLYRSYLQGCHAAGPETSQALLPTVAAQQGIRAAVITDEAALGQNVAVSTFPERMQLSPAEPVAVALAEEQTQLGQLFSAALHWLEGVRSPFLLWIHAQGMNGAWDAPRQYREQFADEEDPDPPNLVIPPNEEIDANFDPDELLGLSQAYAGQVALLDVCMGTLLQALESHPRGNRTMLILASPRGFPLGEHGCIGACGDGLHGEVVHVPLLVRIPESDPQQARISSFTQPADLHATLGDWLNLSLETGFGHSLLNRAAGNASWQHAYVCATAGDQRAIRTPAWFFRETDSGSTALYAKPDDRWEVNEVADRCPEIVDQLKMTMHRYLELVRAGEKRSFPALVPELLEPQ